MHNPENTPSASLKWLGRWNVVALTTRWLRANATAGPTTEERIGYMKKLNSKIHVD